MARFVIYRASAGAGKTYTLVRQFIETAISSKSQLEHRFEHILAITFTNKAANGMKERIMTQLHSIVEGGSEKLCNEMAGRLSVTVDEVRRRCAIVQSAILHHYSELSVCTIDSFVHRLVRTFAHDLKLPMNFDVMIDNQQIIQSTVDQLLALAGTDGNNHLTEALCAYTQSRMDAGKSYRLEKQLSELAKEIFKEQTPRYLERLRDIKMEDYVEIHNWLAEECRKVEKQLTTEAEKLMTAMRKEDLTVNDFPYKKSGALSLFIRLEARDYSKLNDPYKRAETAYTKGLWGSKTGKVLKSKMENLMPVYKEVYDAVSNILAKELRAYNSRQLLLSNLFGLAMLSQLNKIKDDYYRDNEIVHISEFNKKIAEEVMNEPTPFIYERIGSRYYNYMIDEFQDTSKLQWSNFLPLLDEAMTHDFAPDTAEPGTQSIVVGDGKQAIYRFRQGDVRQFMMLPLVESKLHGLSLAGNAELVSLGKNYRTLRNIVEFNNRFFESIIRKHFQPTGDQQIRFAGTQSATMDVGNPELTKLYLGKLELEAGEKPDLIQEPVKEGGYVQIAFSDRDGIYENILKTIRHQVDDLGYNYGDIMLLARDRATLVSIADYITTNGGENAVPIVSSESFLLSQSPEVLLLQSLLEYIYNPRNKVAALQAVRLWKEDMEWRLRNMDYDLEKLINGLLPAIDGRSAFDVNYLRTMPLYDLCEALVRIFKLEGKGNRFLSTFMNVVNNFVQKGHADLGEFVKYLDEKMEHLSSATATDIDAVQLMTIHKAKGLESKIVIYALPQKRVRNSSVWVEVDDAKKDEFLLPVAFVGTQKISTIFDEAFKEEARLNDMDRINVLYVAMTRPEEKLFVFCEDVKETENNTTNQALLKAFAMSDESMLQKVVLSTEEDKSELLHGNALRDAERYGEPSDITNETTVFAVGDDGRKSDLPEKGDADEIVGIDRIVYPDWGGRVSIAQQSAALLSPFDEDNRRYGILIHDLLSQIIVAEDVDVVVDRYCKEQELPDAVREDVLCRIKKMMERDGNARFFDGNNRVMCEVSIAVEGKVRRPDRIVFAKDETFVVDFKTGSRDDRSHEKYLCQVAEYARALTDMGYPNVKPVIVYL